MPQRAVPAFYLYSPVAHQPTSFKGNKSALQSKPCAACGRAMTWRKSWAKNWDEVKYCSEACRKNKKS
jgi:hypothetical protein